MLRLPSGPIEGASRKVPVKKEVPRGSPGRIQTCKHEQTTDISDRDMHPRFQTGSPACSRMPRFRHYVTQLDSNREDLKISPPAGPRPAEGPMLRLWPKSGPEARFPARRHYCVTDVPLLSPHSSLLLRAAWLGMEAEVGEKTNTKPSCTKGRNTN